MHVEFRRNPFANNGVMAFFTCNVSPSGKLLFHEPYLGTALADAIRYSLLFYRVCSLDWFPF